MEPANVTVAAKCFDDRRFERLAMYLGLPSGDDARIKCARIWRWQRDNFSSSKPTYVVDAETIDVEFGTVGAHEALVKAGLAEVVDGGYRIKGSNGRIEQVWTARSAKGRKAPTPSSRDGSGDRSRDRSGDTSGDPKVGTYIDPDLGSDLLSSERSDLSEALIRNERSLDLVHPGSESGDPSRDLPRFKAKVDKNSAEAKAARIARIPERAFKAADYLRKLILEDSPTCSLRTKDWSSDATQRVKWADEIRILVERDGRTYEELADILDWLFHKQPSGPHRYIVQSVDSLRTKWDRIQKNRSNRSASHERKSPTQIALEELERIEKESA